MKQATKAKLLKLFRTLHGWIGIIIFPWILIIGFTGFYMNHSKLVLSWVEGPSYDESQFSEWPDIGADEAMARALAAKLWPDEPIRRIDFEPYHGRNAIHVAVESGRVIMSQPTGHYFVKEGFTRETFAPDGTLLHSKTYWGSVFKTLHERGWLSNRFGTLISDAIAFALIIFALTGLVIWWLPRMKKVARLFGKLRPNHNILSSKS